MQRLQAGALASSSHISADNVGLSYLARVEMLIINAGVAEFGHKHNLAILQVDGVVFRCLQRGGTIFQCGFEQTRLFGFSAQRIGIHHERFAGNAGFMLGRVEHVHHISNAGLIAGKHRCRIGQGETCAGYRAELCKIFGGLAYGDFVHRACHAGADNGGDGTVNSVNG